MDDTLAVVGPRYVDNLLLDDCYDFGGHDTVQVQQGEPAGRLLLDHDNTVTGYVPLDSPGLCSHEIDSFLFTDYCPEDELERIQELMSAQSQRLVAAHEKRSRDAASDDADAVGGARGAPRRAVGGARPADQQLEPPAPKNTPADREPVATTRPLKRDAGTQVSEAQLQRECVGTSTRDVSTQVSEDELRDEDDDDMGEHSPSPVDEHQDPVQPFVPSELEVLPVNQADDGSEAPDAAGGVYEDGLQLQPMLPFDGSADFTEFVPSPYRFEAYAAPVVDQDFVPFDGSADFTEYASFPYQFEDQDFVGLIDDFCD